jgi:endonuclease YncB( thermonuclease family)
MDIQILTPEEETSILNSSSSYPEFNLDGLLKICKVISVYDGDTIKVCFLHNGVINKWTIRLIGLDTPELRPLKTKPNRLEEIAQAKASRDYLKNILINETSNTNKLWYLLCKGFDKYGRLLGEVFPYNTILFNNSSSNIHIGAGDIILHPSSINSLLIENGHAKYYNGGKR